jgi:hypothetical protein
MTSLHHSSTSCTQHSFEAIVLLSPLSSALYVRKKLTGCIVCVNRTKRNHNALPCAYNCRPLYAIVVPHSRESSNSTKGVDSFVGPLLNHNSRIVIIEISSRGERSVQDKTHNAPYFDKPVVAVGQSVVDDLQEDCVVCCQVDVISARSRLGNALRRCVAGKYRTAYK